METRHSAYLRRKLTVCVRNARDANRNVLDMKKGAAPDPGRSIAWMIAFFRKGRAESMATAREYAEELAAELDVRRYHVVAVNEKNGTKTVCTGYPMNHVMACRNKAAFSQHPLRRMQLELAP